MCAEVVCLEMSSQGAERQEGGVTWRKRQSQYQNVQLHCLFDPPGTLREFTKCISELSAPGDTGVHFSHWLRFPLVKSDAVAPTPQPCWVVHVRVQSGFLGQLSQRSQMPRQEAGDPFEGQGEATSRHICAELLTVCGGTGP